MTPSNFSAANLNAQPDTGVVSEQKIRKFSQLSQLYILTDAAALFLGALCSLYLVRLVNVFIGADFANSLLGYESARLISFAVIAAGVMVWFQHKGHYRVRMNFWMELKQVICTLGLAMLVDGFFQFATKNDPSRLWLMSGWFFAAFSVLLFRGFMRRWLRRAGAWQVPTLLVGAGATAVDTATALASESGMGFQIVAQVKNLPEAFMQVGRSWEKLCAVHHVEYVVIALDGQDLDAAEQPIAQLMRESVPFSISPPRRNLPVLDMVPQYFFNSDVKLLTHNSGLEQPMPRLFKRLFDIAVSGIMLVMLSPLMLLLGAMTKCDGGPMFFGHQRVGKNGKLFYCLKFRSMAHNSQALLERHLAESPEAKTEWDATHKLKNDPRVTKLGAFLRKSSLDELPQLINVLRGEMSLVGPRPIVAAEIQKYQYDIAHYYRVSPGITGLWQVSGRNDVSYEQRVKMDSWYVRNWSLWHDIAIMCKTVPALLKRGGAY